MKRQTLELGGVARVVGFLLSFSLLAPLGLGAALLQQGGGVTPPPGGGAPVASLSEGDRGFLFERPRVTLAIRSGLFFHRAGSDIFTFATERFTLDRSDFRGLSLGVEGSVWLGNRLEGTLILEGSRVTLDSESRDWLEEDGSPIRQTTRLTSGPSAALGIRYFLFDRGEALGSLIWIPQRWNLFVGGGAGVSRYRFEQWGDFVNEADTTIFSNQVISKGGVFTPYLTGGATMNLTPRILASFEGRYQWGKTDLQRHFTGFEPIDLSGLRTTMSLGYSF